MYETRYADNRPPSLDISIFAKYRWTVKLVYKLWFSGNMVFPTHFFLAHFRSYLQINITLFSSFGNTVSFAYWRKSFCTRENPWHCLFVREYMSCFNMYACAWNLPDLSPIHTKQLAACNLSQAIFVACNLTVHTVRQIAEIFTCKIFPAKTCPEYVEVCMIITMVLSVEEETVIMHCFYCTCGATSSMHTTRTELLDMDIAKTSLRSKSSQHPFSQLQWFPTWLFLISANKQVR